MADAWYATWGSKYNYTPMIIWLVVGILLVIDSSLGVYQYNNGNFDKSQTSKNIYIVQSIFVSIGVLIVVAALWGIFAKVAQRGK